MASEADGYEAFFQEQYPKVVATLIYHHGFAEQIADEAAQEAMTRLLLDWKKINNPQAWMRTVAFRQAVRIAKDQHARLPDTPLADPQAAADLAAVELALMAGAAVKTLPPRQQEVMTLTLADLKPEEIAEILGCTPEQTRGNLAHARRALQRALGTEEA
ncbi:sigma-70 family RNA polymerase sigma factor [Streptomyces sp. ME02-8801-2C]|uniref:RNA polymerase sigma factor n=1 Tax=Streptomyces sp. ME02-8801-2C TaxID=3028680 RepID=UPI0029BCFFC2|nr:sigma-70 family RNA polymerase sigma factor [Streptomyces sp. ME02-8801-2C]MDX3458806.1 sigma-70 family RNA polymerase sigma factor [Streptomyces sp. ME02-8801-2C]